MFGTAKHRKAAYGGRDPRWWPLLLLLLTVVLLPTACLLWLMTKAIDNERLAVRQILAETCRGQLVRLRSRWDEHWQSRSKQLQGEAAGKSSPGAFAAIVRQQLADGAVCRDGQGHPAYPAHPPPADVPIDEAAWARPASWNTWRKAPGGRTSVRRHRQGGPPREYGRPGLVAEARSIARAGQRDQAIEILANTLAEERFRRAVDGEGRLIVADAELRALELIGDRRPRDSRRLPSGSAIVSTITPTRCWAPPNAVS